MQLSAVFSPLVMENSQRLGMQAWRLFGSELSLEDMELDVSHELCNLNLAKTARAESAPMIKEAWHSCLSRHLHCSHIAAKLRKGRHCAHAEISVASDYKGSTKMHRTQHAEADQVRSPDGAGSDDLSQASLRQQLHAQ